MMAGVKIPLSSLSAALSVILKLQIDETQLKKDQKGNFFSFQPLLYNSIIYRCQLSLPTSSAPLLPLDMTMCSCSTLLLHPSVFVPRLLLPSEPMRSYPKSTLDPNPTKCEPFSCHNCHRLHLCLR